MPTKKRDLSSRSDIEQLVSIFYERALIDPTIGFFFTEVKILDLKIHLPKIVDFWCSLLLGDKSYQGNPMVKHLALNRLHAMTEEHFTKWLALWNLSVAEHFSGPKATEAVKRAEQIAGLMKHKIKMDALI